jgi:hypothetical protein
MRHIMSISRFQCKTPTQRYQVRPRGLLKSVVVFLRRSSVYILVSVELIMEHLADLGARLAVIADPRVQTHTLPDAFRFLL